MPHTESLAFPRYETSGEPFGPRDRDSFDPDAIIGFVRRSWRLCLIWVGVGLCASIAFLIVSPVYYTAYSTVLFNDSGARPAATGTEADAVASAYVDTQVQVLQSAEVVGRVVDRQRLVEDREFGIGRPSTDPEVRHATILRTAAALSVRRIGISDAVSIGFTSRSRLRSAAITNAIVHNYVNGRLELQRQNRDGAVAELRARLAEVRDKAFAIEPPQNPASGMPQSASQAKARFRELQDNAQAYRAMYDNLLQRANAAAAAESPSVAVRVIAQAEPPLHRTWPRTFIVLGLATALAAAFGLGQALFREVADRSLRSAEDVEQVTGLDCITRVPKMERQAWVTGDVAAGGLQPAYLNAAADFCQPMVRLAVRLQRPNRRKFVAGVVAPSVGAGTSSAAAHLANILADGGQKTLLVDANWRKPTTGLSMPESSRSGMLARGLTAIHLEPGKLDVLVLRAMAAISPLAASLSIVSALQHLQAEYDCVIVDFHSADETADLEASMAVINAVIVVVEAERTTAESLRNLLKVLPGDQIEAVIVNKIASAPRDLRAEFGHFVEPIVRSLRTALPWGALLLDRLGAARQRQTEAFQRARLFGGWLLRAAWSGRRQLR